MNSQMPRHLISDGNMDDIDVTRSRVPSLSAPQGGRSNVEHDPSVSIAAGNVPSPRILVCGSLGGINENLHRLIPQRSLDAIKSHRREAAYKGFVLEYRLFGRVGPYTRVEWFQILLLLP